LGDAELPRNDLDDFTGGVLTLGEDFQDPSPNGIAEDVEGRASGPRVERDGSYRLRARLFGNRSRRDVRLAPRFAALADERLSLGRERRLPKAGLKFHVTALVCEVTGGPCKYSGRTMKQSHEHLNITDPQWQGRADDGSAFA
jgi:hypothetical protein